MVIILITFKSSLPALISVLIAFIFCIDIKIYCFKVFSLKTKFLKQILEKRALIENVNAALPYMDADMRELAKRTLSKVDALTEAEFAELPIYAADEV